MVVTARSDVLWKPLKMIQNLNKGPMLASPLQPLLMFFEMWTWLVECDCIFGNLDDLLVGRQANAAAYPCIEKPTETNGKQTSSSIYMSDLGSLGDLLGNHCDCLLQEKPTRLC